MGPSQADVDARARELLTPRALLRVLLLMGCVGRPLVGADVVARELVPRDHPEQGAVLRAVRARLDDQLHPLIRAGLVNCEPSGEALLYGASPGVLATAMDEVAGLEVRMAGFKDRGATRRPTDILGEVVAAGLLPAPAVAALVRLGAATGRVGQQLQRFSSWAAKIGACTES